MNAEAACRKVELELHNWSTAGGKLKLTQPEQRSTIACRFAPCEIAELVSNEQRKQLAERSSWSCTIGQRRDGKSEH